MWVSGMGTLGVKLRMTTLEYMVGYALELMRLRNVCEAGRSGGYIGR